MLCGGKDAGSGEAGAEYQLHLFKAVCAGATLASLGILFSVVGSLLSRGIVFVKVAEGPSSKYGAHVICFFLPEGGTVIRK